jgi:hypothetical protein
MGAIQCEAGLTQIGRTLQHALREHEKAPLHGITFMGDAMEEDLGALGVLADELGAAGVPLHMCQEGNDAVVRNAFRLLALKTGGTYSAFNPAVPQTIERLSAQLNKVARGAVSPRSEQIGVISNSPAAGTHAAIAMRRHQGARPDNPETLLAIADEVVRTDNETCCWCRRYSRRLGCSH